MGLLFRIRLLDVMGNAGEGCLLTDEVGFGAAGWEGDGGFSGGGGVVVNWEGVGGCGEGEGDDGGELHFCCFGFWVGKVVGWNW